MSRIYGKEVYYLPLHLLCFLRQSQGQGAFGPGFGLLKSLHSISKTAPLFCKVMSL